MNKSKNLTAVTCIAGYYFPLPQERSPEQRTKAFDRAKAETIQKLKVQLENVKAITAEDFFGIGGA